MQVGIFNCLFIFVIAALNDYVIVASIIVIAIRNSINCAALPVVMFSVFVAFLMNKVYYNKGPIQLTTKKMIYCFIVC